MASPSPRPVVGVLSSGCGFLDGSEIHARLLRELHAQRKPLGAACIAPALVATVFARAAEDPRLTIGEDAGTAAALERLGARHEACAVDGIVVDDTQRIAGASSGAVGATGSAAASSGATRSAGAVGATGEAARQAGHPAGGAS